MSYVDVVQQGRLPAAEREAHRVLVGAARRLPDEIEGREELDVDEAHGLLPTRCRHGQRGDPRGRPDSSVRRWSWLTVVVGPSSASLDPGAFWRRTRGGGGGLRSGWRWRPDPQGGLDHVDGFVPTGVGLALVSRA